MSCTCVSCHYVSLNALDEMHLSRVFYVFLNTSNKLRDNIVISIVNNLYFISIYIYIYTRFLHVESIFWSDGICILRPFCCWRPRIHRKTIVFPDIRSRWQIYWSPLFRTRTQLYQSYKLLDLLAKNFTVCSCRIVRTAETKLITRANILQRITYE